MPDPWERDDDDGHDPFERDAEEWWELEEIPEHAPFEMVCAVIERNNEKLDKMRHLLAKDRSFALSAIRLKALRVDFYRSRGMAVPTTAAVPGE